MGIYNPWAEMPESCIVCDYRKKCQLSNQNIFGLSSYKSNHCPLVEVKSPHGRLIDENRVMEEWWLRDELKGETMEDYLIEAKTLIEAEEENA